MLRIYKTLASAALVAATSAIGAIAPVTSAFAEQKPIALPSDTRIVRFTYDPNNTYTILTRPMAVTNIQLSDDEELVAFALGDTVQWVTTDSPGHVFIKPIAPDLVTSGTLVTTKRTYQLTLRSSPENGIFFQQVTWHNPALIALRQQQQEAQRNMAEARLRSQEQAVEREQQRLQATVVSPGVELEKLNFDYSVKGKAKFAPTQIFDDGKFTWLRMPDHQEMPAVFMLNEKGDAELLNFTIRDRYIVIQRLVPGLLLKLGKEEIEINRKGAKRRGFFSNWSSGGDYDADYYRN